MIHRAAIALFSITLLSGCATRTVSHEQPASTVRIVPDPRLHGRIASVNTQGQFVVIDFNVGRIPPLNSHMQVYRENKVVGEINLSGPINDNLVAADVVRGELTLGDLAIWDSEKPAKKENPDAR